MISHEDIREIIGLHLLDSGGDKVGKIGQVFLDDKTGEPEWATVNTGFFGRASFVPAREAHRTGDAVRPLRQGDHQGRSQRAGRGAHLEESQERDYAY